MDSTVNLASDSPPRMGRKRQWAEDMVARFAAGTFARMARLLRPKETKTDFVREAVERELDRREAGRNVDPRKGERR